MNCLIGIDGGGSFTRAIAVDHSGHIIATSVTGPTCLQFLDKKRTQNITESLISCLLEQAGTSVGSVDFLVAGFAGAGRKQAQEIMESVLRKIGFRENISITSDLEIAHYGAFLGAAGIVLNAGTGSSAMCCDSSGAIVRCGGWGYLIGDEGSAYHMGRLAFGNIFKSLDGSIADTSLSETLCNEFQLAAVEELITRLYSGTILRSSISAFAPRVFHAAQEGDSVAREIVAECGSALGALVETLLKRARFDVRPVPLCCTGGMFENRDLLLPLIYEVVKNEVRIAKPRFAALEGAVLMGFDKANIPVDAEMKANLKNNKSK
jgi:N-acetylglucosamine kinase-like BadF-type ATPase